MTRMSNPLTSLLVAIICLMPTAYAGTLDSDAPMTAPAQFEVTPQFVRFATEDVTIQAYGAEFGAWYRVAEGWDTGASLRQGASAIGQRG